MSVCVRIRFDLFIFSKSDSPRSGFGNINHSTGFFITIQLLFIYDIWWYIIQLNIKVCHVSFARLFIISMVENNNNNKPLGYRMLNCVPVAWSCCLCLVFEGTCKRINYPQSSYIFSRWNFDFIIKLSEPFFPLLRGLNAFEIFVEVCSIFCILLTQAIVQCCSNQLDKPIKQADIIYVDI